jgi:hypothetical protein
MADKEKDRHLHNNFRKVLMLLLPFLMTISVILITLNNSFLEALGGVLLFCAILDAVAVALFLRKYYNWSLVFLLLIVIAIIFRSQRWPLTGLIFGIGFTGLGCVSMISSVIFFKKYNHIPFLKYIGFASSIILSVVSMGLLWKNMHWPLAGIILNSGLVVFIPFLFAFVFTLPGSNYINWDKSERIVFFRAVIIPMTFLYILSVLMFVFPDLWTSITRLPLKPFRMEEIDLLKMPGLI